ncbi:biotin-dependent carboxyltransferase family protein [Heliorestis acidaminivorans]|uniref:Biotin-dependent carboxyltransferase family protein n=1 Tax=Heliorestis acidaminivorans TaxID=553427 RepID=A0A6I0ESI8_9FIRM|nr:biotin-dependent carboxyltransferase family protein [Heliorestis acidaminivorans]KAB2952868.1 biotin-dependent carboxyltransferase family protein [Heliorestis acidaminivorans]
MTIEVLRAGIFTTIQDKGRYGYQGAGIPVAGAMDLFALQVANRLVGNDLNKGALEMTLQGPTLKFHKTTMIAITGADMTATIEGKPLPQWVNIPIPKGSIINFGPVQKGCRTYLAISNGFNLPSKMGSTSTYVRGAIGGFQGRALKKGDILPLHDYSDIKGIGLRALDPRETPQYTSNLEIEVIEGPQKEYFTDEAWQIFLSQPYSLTTEANRMGYPLEPLNHKALTRKIKKEMLSDATALGAIQVPPHGKPIILMADRQTTGGYPKIATVISAHMTRLAQAQPQPNHIITFIKSDLKRAHQLAREQQKVIEEKILTGEKGKNAWLEQALLQRGQVKAQFKQIKDSVEDIYEVSWTKERVISKEAVSYPEQFIFMN